MFKNVSSEGGLPGGRSLASAAALGASPAGLGAQESSWLGLLSVFSRPSFAFVSRYLPAFGGSGSVSGGVMESELLRQLDARVSTLPWFHENSLRQLGIDAVDPAAVPAPAPAPSGKDRWWSGSYGGDLMSAHLARAHPCLTTELDGEPLRESAGTEVPREEASGGQGQERGRDQDHGYYSLEEEHGLGAPHRTEPKEEAPPPPPPPQCRNLSIAFIMGCPCSDDEDDDSGQSDFDSDDDDDQSDGDDDDIDQSDVGSDDSSDKDDETARLLASFCRREDPYNPQNFSARLHTGRGAPPTDGVPPLAPDATRGHRSQPSASVKKVRFSDTVQEFLLEEEEDRRGPWEELARDRGRFLRRCREAELVLARCLEPEHRRRAYLRLNSRGGGP